MSDTTSEDDELRGRAGGSEVIAFMESNGFRLTSNEYNKFGFWFNEKDQMTEGLTQAAYMFNLIKQYGIQERLKAFQNSRDVILLDEKAIDAVDEYIWQEKQELTALKDKEV